MAINKFLLEKAKSNIKRAFQAPPGGVPPMDPSMGGAPPMDPSMGGAPPMDPSMMGGAPPGGAPPMDPSMGGAPPMDPSMMGGAPPGGAPPMDPSMMGGAPAGDPTQQIRSVVQDELQRALAEVKGGKGAKKPQESGNAEIFMHRIQKLLTHLYSSLGISLPNDILDSGPNPSSASPPQGGSSGVAPSGAPSGAPSPAQEKTSEYAVTEKLAGMLHYIRKGSSNASRLS